jgi:hypothetical protein
MQISAPRFISNVLMLLGLLIAGAYLVDRLWLWMGWAPWAFCGVMPVLDLVLGKTVALVLITVGLLGLLVSGFKDASSGALVAGGFLLSILPQLIGGHLGVFCHFDKSAFPSKQENVPLDLSGFLKDQGPQQGGYPPAPPSPAR